MLQRVIRPQGQRIALSLIPGAVCVAVASTAAASASWSTLGVPTNGFDYGDLNVVLLAADCAAADPGWSLESVPCNPGMAIYNYPSVWARGFALLGLGADARVMVAVTLMALFAASLSVLAYLALAGPRRLLTVVVMSICGILPPVLLGFQRGNIDLAVFGLLTAAIVAFVAGANRSSGVLIGLAAVLKLFPVGAAVMLLLDRAKWRGAILSFAVVTAIGISLEARDLPFIASRTPQLDGAAFGASQILLLLGPRAGLTASTSAYKVIGLVGFVVVAAIIVLLVRRSAPIRAKSELLVHEIAADRSASALIAAGSGAFLVAYLIGPSFDYRLVFLIPAIAGLTRVGSTASLTVAAVLLLQLVVSYSSLVGAAEYLSDGALLVVAPALALLIAQVVAVRWRHPVP